MCLKDHAAGRCPQIPYYSISLLAAGVTYLADQLDFVPDFLPRILDLYLDSAPKALEEILQAAQASARANQPDLKSLMWLILLRSPRHGHSEQEFMNI